MARRTDDAAQSTRRRSPAEGPGRRWLESFKTPEARGEDAAEYILNSLETIPRCSAEEREAQRRYLSELDVPAFWREFYGIPQAARDLAPVKLVRIPAEIEINDLRIKCRRSQRKK